jgi:hypothetical protein
VEHIHTENKIHSDFWRTADPPLLLTNSSCRFASPVYKQPPPTALIFCIIFVATALLLQPNHSKK